MLEDFIPLLLASSLLLAYLFVLSFITPALGLAAIILVSIMVPIEISLQWGQLPRIGPTRIVVGIFLIAYLLRLCVSTTNHRQNVVFAKDKPLYLMYFLPLYVCTILVSYMFTVNVKASTLFIIDQLVVFSIFLIFVNEIRKDENWIMIKQTIYFGTLLVCFFALFEVWTRANPIIDFVAPNRNEVESIVRLDLWRVRSTFYHPIALGVFLNLVFPFVLVDLFNSVGVKRLRLTVLVFLMCVAQILTVSRIPWLVMIFETTIVFMFFSRITLSKIILILNVSMICAIAVFAIYSSSDFIHKLFEPFLNWGGVFSIFLRILSDSTNSSCVRQSYWQQMDIRIWPRHVPTRGNPIKLCWEPPRAHRTGSPLHTRLGRFGFIGFGGIHRPSSLGISHVH